jgi:hypothetical protein
MASKSSSLQSLRPDEEEEEDEGNEEEEAKEEKDVFGGTVDDRGRQII